MHGNIILVYGEGSIEVVPICDDVRSDVKVSCLLIILLEECVEVTGWLCK